MSKGNYSAVDFKGWFSRQEWERFVDDDELVLGIDAAKYAFYAAVMGARSNAADVLYFERDDIRSFVDMVKELPFEKITLVMEPSGTYVDALLELAWEADLRVIRISGSTVNAAQAVFDDTRSLHDGKAATVLGHLYLTGRVGKPWVRRTESRRDIRALVDLDELIRKGEQIYVGPLEAFLARHWPELTNFLELKSMTLLELIARFGSPQEVAENKKQARQLMKKAGGHFLSHEKIEAVLESAQTTIGVETTRAQRDQLKYIAGMLRESHKRSKKIRKQLKEIAEEREETQALVDFAGHRMALILVAYLGDLRNYESVGHLEKAQGLNLREYSTGKTKKDKQTETPRLAISKNGPPEVRKALYWLAIRMINPTLKTYCPIADAWYRERRRRNGDLAIPALVALMRKLSRALWHVAHGRAYDKAQLFNVVQLRRHGHL